MKLRTLIASFAALAGITTAQADAVYKRAWIEDFENSETYLDQIYVGGIQSSLLGVNYAEKQSIKSVRDYTKVYGPTDPRDSSHTALTVSQELRTEKDTQASTHYMRCGHYGSWGISLNFMMPDVVKTATDYRLSFKYLLAASYDTKNTATNGLVVVGTDGRSLATFGVPPNGSNTEKRSDGLLFVGDSVDGLVKSDLTSTGRGKYDVSGAWLRVTVSGSESQGVSMSVEDDNGTFLWSGKISDEFTTIDSLYLRSKANNYQHYACLDDVELLTPAAGETYTWTGASGDGLWTTPGNWLVDGAVPLSVPTSLDVVEIPAGATVVVPTDLAYKTVSLGDGAKLCVLVSEVGDSFKIPEGLQRSDIIVGGPFEVTEESGVLTVSARVASTFVWSAGAAGAWNAASSWLVNGLPTLVTPVAADTARFDGDATVDFASEASIASLEIAEGKTVSANGNGKTLSGVRYFGSEVTKSGKLVLNKLNLKSYSMDGTITDPIVACYWYGDLEIAGEGYTNTIYCMSTDQKSTIKRLNLYGNLSGTGTLRLMGEGHHNNGVFDGRASVSLYGDNTAFTGMGIVNNNSYSGRSYSTFCSATASGSATWVLENCLYLYDVNNLAGTIETTVADSIVAFGAINGQAVLSAGGKEMNVKLVEIGGANTDFETWLSFTSTAGTRPGNYATLKKVGTGTMTFGGGTTHPCWTTNVLAGGVWKMNDPLSLVTPAEKGGRVDTTVVFKGGTVAFGEAFVDESGDVLDISKNIKNSSAPVSVLVEDGQNVVWTNALAASNVGGLVKKGAGTLTLAKTPAYAGPIRIEGGKLVVEDAIDLGETGSTVQIDDPVAAYEAGTVYLEATRIVGKATIDTHVDPKIAEKYRLMKRRVNGKSCLCVGKVAGIAIIIK